MRIKKRVAGIVAAMLMFGIAAKIAASADLKLTKLPTDTENLYGNDG